MVQTLVFSRSYLHRHVSPPETLVVKGGTTWARNGRRILPENPRLPRNIQGSFTCRKSTTWDKRLYFPSERIRAEEFFFFALKNPNLSTKGQHATSRPPKQLLLVVCNNFQQSSKTFFIVLYCGLFVWNSISLFTKAELCELQLKGLFEELD